MTMATCQSGKFVAPMQQKQRGAGYFEFAVVAAVLGILMVVFLQRVLWYREQAERVAVETVLAQLRTALAVKASELYLRGKRDELAALAGQNPMDWMLQPPANYLGEKKVQAGEVLDSGNWFFDPSTKTLSYLSNNLDFLPTSSPKRLNFKVKFDRDLQNLTNNHSAPGSSGVSLVQVEN